MKLLLIIFLLSLSITSRAKSENSLRLSGHVFPQIRLNIFHSKSFLEDQGLKYSLGTSEAQSFFLETNVNNGQNHKIHIENKNNKYVKVHQQRVGRQDNRDLHFIKLTGLNKSKLKNVRLVVMAN